MMNQLTFVLSRQALAVVLAAILILPAAWSCSSAPETTVATATPSVSPQETARPAATTPPAATSPARTATVPAKPPVPPTKPSPVSQRAVKGTFIEGDTGDAETLNFILAADGSSFSYAGHTMDGLAGFDTQFNLVLRLLAKDIEMSPDGLVYTATIRDDLFWTGGVKVTAEDFVYTLKNLMFSDWLPFNYKTDWQETVDGKTVYVEPEVVNDTTFRITRKTVYPEFIYTLYSLTPYPKHIAVKYEGDAKAFTQAEEFNNLTYTGNLGPYKFEEWIRNDKFVVARNPDYYLGKPAGAPYFEKYIIKLFGTPATRQAALEAGDITLTGIEPQNFARFKRMPNIEVYITPTSGYSLMLFNLRNNGWPGFKDKKVRQALNTAISKELIVQSVLEGFGEPAFSFIPSPSPWYSEDGLHKYGVGPLYDKAKAAGMLFEAGYGVPKGNGYEARDKDGKHLKLTLFTSTGSNVTESMALLTKQELKGIGIEVDVKLVPWPTLLSKYVRNKVPGSNQEPQFNNGKGAVSEEKWDLIIMGLGTNVIAPSGSDVFFITTGGLNFFGYSNPKVDELFQRVRSKEALEKERRKQIYQELAALLSDEQPVEFIAFNKAISGFKKNVKGIEPGLNMGYNYFLWYFE